MKKIRAWLNELQEQPVIKTFLTYLKRAELGQASPMVAYYSLLALFPAIIALGAILPYIGININDTIKLVQTALPSNINTVLIPLIEAVLKRQSVSIFSVGLLVTLWSLSQVIAIFRTRIQRIYGEKKAKSPWLTRLISIGWIIGVIIVQTVVMFFIAISKPLLDEVINFFPGTAELINIIQTAQWPVVIVVLLLGVMVINYAMPAKRPHWRALLAGSTIEVAAFLALTQLFGLYVKIAANKYTFYQAIGSIIIMLIWLNLVATISLLGAVFVATFNTLWQPQESPSLNAVDDDDKLAHNPRWGLTRWKQKHRKS
ncbi:YihY/virulence factor BrkB family protein [Periweissella fabalis]|uniref:YihY/virulence factor BrkB family protein n=1 Tax=Periweissella fabalis TaxID=1070421 RepID=A0A7X6S280_9LACO|nr:YihY/virulence factor BrkB family protein [Periweissella fabalis]MCM0598273.1 YihY/virulence factor BrkB family protein [Periweissella fabalis]NKZ23779.1 YihY/virulence factor BrkB family protein [Periweissella fabalis]